VASKSRKLRTGYTTGASAAAAAKGAALFLVGQWSDADRDVEIPFPDGMRRSLRISRVWPGENSGTAWGSIVKDAGDDPDVTHGIEIDVRVTLTGAAAESGAGTGEMEVPIFIRGGEGVGVVTRPGLSVAIGEPAINPGPRRMIEEAVKEALYSGEASRGRPYSAVEVVVSVPRGETVAKRTLNSRLGILGGISILGTTGIVRPVSSEAWTATISASMSVARASGREEIVLSSGRSSERAHMARYGLPEEAYVMMGDYVEFALSEAAARGFRKVHLSAQWAKMIKIAMAVPQTHVRHGAIDPREATGFLKGLGLPDFPCRDFNTAREIFDLIAGTSTNSLRPILSRVCAVAKGYAESVTGGIPVGVHLVSYEGEIIEDYG
jgi:cobalt-precorrin-5B (C1)-methyltransferase